MFTIINKNFMGEKKEIGKIKKINFNKMAKKSKTVKVP